MDNEFHLIIVYGMMKSGNHAIIKWLFENALRMVISEQVIQKQKIGYKENLKVGDLLTFYNDISRNPPPTDYITPCKITMISVEDEYEPLENIPIIRDVEWKSIQKVFIFRDLKNMIASRKKSREYSEKYFGTTEVMCETWKTLWEAYKRVKEETPKFTQLAIYDKIVSDGDSELVENLGLKKCLRFDQIPRITSKEHKPGWSSFDDDNFTERHKQLSQEDVEFVDNFVSSIKNEI